MRNRLIGCLALVAACAAGIVTPVQAQDAKATEVLAKTRKAIGDHKLDALKTLSVEASLQRNVGEQQLSSDVEMLVESPDKYLRSDVSRLMGMQINTGFNGDKAIVPAGATMTAGGGAMMIRMGGPGGPAAAPGHEGPKPTPEQLEEMNRAQVRSQRAEISRLMLGWFGMAHPALQVQYTYAGEAESPDGKAHVIDVKGSDGFAARLFIDQNNYLPLMVTYQARPPRVVMSRGPQAGRPSPGEAEREMQKAMQEQPLVEISLFFDDWRSVDGIQFPHVMRRASGGTTNEEWTITRVKVNPKIDAKKFAVETK